MPLYSFRQVLIKEVATDYKFTGQMKRENIRWFPPIWDQIKHFFRNGVLVCVYMVWTCMRARPG